MLSMVLSMDPYPFVARASGRRCENPRQHRL